MKWDKWGGGRKGWDRAVMQRHAAGANLAFSKGIPFQQGWKRRATATGLLNDWEKFKDAAKKVGRLVMLTSEDKKHEAEARRRVGVCERQEYARVALGCSYRGCVCAAPWQVRGERVQAVKRLASSADFVQAMLALRPEGGKKARLRRTVDRAVSITHVSALAGR